MSTRFVLDQAAIAALGVDPMFVGPVQAVADAIVAMAGTELPRRTGHYAASVHSTGALVSAEGGAPTVMATIGSRDAGAVALEFGSIHNPPYAPITKSVRALGLRLAESR